MTVLNMHYPTKNIMWEESEESSVDSKIEDLKEIVSDQLYDIRQHTANIRTGKPVSETTVSKYAGISKASYLNYESGESLPSLRALLRLSLVYNCDIPHLLGEPGTNRDIGFICKELGLSQSAIETIKAEKDIENGNEILSWFINNGLAELLRDLSMVDSFDKELLSIYGLLPEQLRAKLEYIALTPLEKEQNYNKIIGTVIEALASMKMRDYLHVRTIINKNKVIIDEKSKTIVFPFKVQNKITLATIQAKRNDTIPPEYVNDIAELSRYVYILSYVAHKYQKKKQQLVFKLSNGFTNLLNQYCAF